MTRSVIVSAVRTPVGKYGSAFRNSRSSRSRRSSRTGCAQNASPILRWNETRSGSHKVAATERRAERRSSASRQWSVRSSFPLCDGRRRPAKPRIGLSDHVHGPHDQRRLYEGPEAVDVEAADNRLRDYQHQQRHKEPSNPHGAGLRARSLADHRRPAKKISASRRLTPSSAGASKKVSPTPRHRSPVPGKPALLTQDLLVAAAALNGQRRLQDAHTLGDLAGVPQEARYHLVSATSSLADGSDSGVPDPRAPATSHSLPIGA
jgi:hypothetical protein